MTAMLKQSTSVTVVMGPFVDKTDGVTPKTALTPTARLSVNGGAWAARHSATAMAHQENGYYSCVLDTTDTATLGLLRVACTDAANNLPVFRDFTVVPANVYDSLIGGSANLQVDAVKIASDTPTATNVKNNIGNLNKSLTAFNDLSAATVLTQCQTALGTDTIAELASVPPAAPTIKQALMMIYMALRNQATASSSQRTIKNNAGTTIATAALSDTGGIFTKGLFS